MTEKRKVCSFILFTTAFFASFALFFLLARMVVSDTVIAPIAPDHSALSPFNSVLSAAHSGSSAALLMLVLYLSGFSTLALPVSVLISAYRGGALGYTGSLMTTGRLLLRGNIHGTSIPTHGVVFLLYILSCAVFAFFSIAAVDRSRGIRGGENISGLTYTRRFLACAGAVAIFEIASGMLI